MRAQNARDPGQVLAQAELFFSFSLINKADIWLVMFKRFNFSAEKLLTYSYSICSRMVWYISILQIVQKIKKLSPKIESIK